MTRMWWYRLACSASTAACAVIIAGRGEFVEACMLAAAALLLVLPRGRSS